MIVICGTILWLTMVVAFARLLFVALPLWRNRASVIILPLLLIAGVLLFRPHEDFMGGQDTGAYINTAAALQRYNAFSYEDPMLAQMTAEEREAFVTTKQYTSKYHCMHLPEPEKSAQMATWFQPAYSTISAVAGKVISQNAIFYIGPLFALLTAISLAVLAWQVFNSKIAALSAFILYILLPLAVWHARFPRPEMAASFLLLAGGNLLIASFRSDKSSNAFDVLLGAICLCLAPFFHMIAWFPLMLAAIIITVAIFWGHRKLLVYYLVQLFFLILLALQIYAVVDTYHLRRSLSLLEDYPFLWLVVAILYLLLSKFLWSASCRAKFPEKRTTKALARVKKVTLIYIPLVFMVYGAVLLIGFEEARTGLAEYIYPTNLNVFVNMLSWGTVLLATAGMILMVLCAPSFVALAFVIIYLSSSIFFGPMTDFFMTRYMMVTLVPGIILASTACVVLAYKYKKWLGALVLIAALFFQVYGRDHLIDSVQFEGFRSLIQKTAEYIKQKDGFVLFEYPQLAAPLDMFYGVNTLPLSDERNIDYRGAEKTWLRLMQEQPDRPAFFITPHTRMPKSKYFNFTLATNITFRGKHLANAGQQLPEKRVPWEAALHIYKMTEKGNAAEEPPVEIYKESFGLGNMGLYGWQRPLTRNHWTAKGRLVTPDKHLELTPPTIGGQMALFSYAPDLSQPDRTIAVLPNDRLRTQHFMPLMKGWYLLVAEIAPGETPIKISAATSGLVTSALMVDSAAKHQRLYDGWSDDQGEEHAMHPPFEVRWAFAEAELLIPPLYEKNAWLCSLVLVPEEMGPRTEFTAIEKVSGVYATQEIPTGRLVWTLWPIQAQTNQQNIFSFWSNIQYSEKSDIIGGFAAAVLLNHKK